MHISNLKHLFIIAKCSVELQFHAEFNRVSHRPANQSMRLHIYVVKRTLEMCNMWWYNIDYLGGYNKFL